MNKHWHKGTNFPEYDDDIVFVSENKTTVGYFDTTDENFIKHSTGQIFHPKEVTKWAYADEIAKQPMDDDTFEFINDAMCWVLDLLDDLSNPDFQRQYNKLDKAIDKFYSCITTMRNKMEPKYTRYVSFCVGKINIYMLGLVKLNSWNIGIDFLKNEIIIKVPTFWIFINWKKHESKEHARKWAKYYNKL